MPVYRVIPESRASFAALMMWLGVSKSGSPAPNPITFSPAFSRSRAFWVTAMVGEGLIAFSRSAMNSIFLIPIITI